jgi:hypothetical protein
MPENFDNITPKSQSDKRQSNISPLKTPDGDKTLSTGDTPAFDPTKKSVKARSTQSQIQQLKKEMEPDYLTQSPSAKLNKIFENLYTDAQYFPEENIKFRFPDKPNEIIDLGIRIKQFVSLSQIYHDLISIYQNTQSDDIKHTIKEKLNTLYHTDPTNPPYNTEIDPNIIKKTITDLSNQSIDHKIPETTINKVPNLFGQFFYLPPEEIVDLEKVLKVTNLPENNTRENAIRYLNLTLRKTLRENNLLPNQIEINQYYQTLCLNPNIEDALEAEYHTTNGYQKFTTDYQRILEDIQLFDPECLKNIYPSHQITRQIIEKNQVKKPSHQSPASLKPWWKFW